MTHQAPINPKDLEKHFRAETMQDAINDIISRFNDQVFTTRHIETALHVYPEYKKHQKQKGFYNAIRHTLSVRMKAGDLERIGNYNGTHYAAYRAKR